MKSMILFLALVLIQSFFGPANYASADVSIKTEPSKEKFEEIDLLSGAQLNIDSQNIALTKISHGLRKKAIFGLVPVRVYVLQLLAAKKDKLVKTDEGVLKSLKESGPIMLQLSFLRDLPGSKISEAFKDGLESNKINIKKLSPELTSLLNEIANIKEFKKNESFSIAINWTKQNSTAYLKQDGKDLITISGNSEFAEQLLSIWFGNPSDSRLGDLKKSLIN